MTGREFSGKLLAGPNELYAELLGTWYGTKHSGLGTLKQLGQSRLNTVPGAQQSSAQQPRQHADEIFDGTIADGPTLDDADTWEFKGTLDADGIAKLSEQSGQTLTAQQRNALQALQNATNVTADVGKDDHLLRRANVSIDLNSDDLQKLQTTGSQLSGLNALHVSLGIDLGKWGETVTITPPESYKPLPSLTSSLGLSLS
ncbi:MAG TPA: hypothetical protein VF895_11595 [Gaiellaceae bacterium]